MSSIGSGCLSRGKPINGKKICNFCENSYPQEESYPQVRGGGSILTNQLKIQKRPFVVLYIVYVYYKTLAKNNQEVFQTSNSKAKELDKRLNINENTPKLNAIPS